jgi:hypothetical protein
MSENPLKTPFTDLHAGLVAAAAEEEFVIDAQAVRELDAGLIEALVHRDTLADSAYRDRYSALQALSAVIRFLQAHDKWRTASRPLAQLQAALRDLDNGHQAAMLRPAPVEHRPVSWYETTLRGYAAAIMGGLMKHARMPKREAAEWVSRRLDSAGQDVAPGTVVDWRKRALDHKAHPELHRAYCTVLGKPDWSKPLACAERLAANLIGLQPQKGG